MTTLIGYMYNYREGSLPKSGYTLYRAVPMAQTCHEHGYELFLYSPSHIDAKTNQVKGYLFKNNKFVPHVADIPKVNGDWYMGKNASREHPEQDSRWFHSWLNRHEIQIYPPIRLSHELSDKFTAYKTVEKSCDVAQPYTELVVNLRKQLEKFLEDYDFIFLKPNAGNKGNRIYVIEKEHHGFTLSFYNHKQKVSHVCNSIDDILQICFRVVTGRPYIIQQGIDIPKYARSRFLIRTIAIDDGNEWHQIHKVVLASMHGDVANTTQGGSNYFLEDFCQLIMDEKQAADLMNQIQTATEKLLDVLNQHYPNSLMEIGFDYLMDSNGMLYLDEINTKPGMAKPGIDFSDPQQILHMKPGQQKFYDQYLLPHGKYLAEFLIHKLEHSND